MTYRPLLGSQQLDARFDGGPPRLRVRGLIVYRAFDGSLLCRNEGISTDYVGRSGAATIHDTSGNSGTLAASEPAFTSVDWDRDGSREADALLLGDEEALRMYDFATGRLLWDTGPKTVRLDWIETGAALIADTPYWSFTTDAATGAYLAILGGGDGTVLFEHYNGTSSVASSVAVNPADCCSLRAIYNADGSVQAGLVRNSAANETVSARSAALTPAASWGAGGATICRLNEFGNSVRGEQLARYLAVYGAILTRQQLMEVL
ncbi:hypothetical protein [Gemmatimonas sp.]|jgi:hypothetical protein|uniref:hypothetical protein n=1 Tax=Gemmatimonas sp. TaxID=1962908 RepID=UPI0037BFD2AF